MPDFQLTTVFDSKTHDSFPRYLVKNFQQVIIFRFAIYNFVRNEIRKRYRRSTLGLLWSLLNPLLTMMVIATVFSLIFKIELRNFAVYIFSGLAPWGYINACALGGSSSLVYAEGYLKKVYVPKVVFPIVTITTETVNFLFSLTSVYILALIVGFPLTWRVVLLPGAVLLTYLFLLGLVLMFSTATVYFRDMTQIITVMFSALFYTVPILFPISEIPSQFHVFIKLNPLYYYIGLFRKIIYDPSPMVLSDWLIPLALSLCFLTAGLFVLKSRDRDIVYRL
jgi:ABC-type polysaccharide/polyol phosphate export permease